MGLSCSGCGKVFKSIGEVADHISEARQGELHTPDKADTTRVTNKDTAHGEYLDRDGKKLDDKDEGWLTATVMAGYHRCTKCNIFFPNQFRYYQHIVKSGHDSFMMHYALRVISDLEEFENKFF